MRTLLCALAAVALLAPGCGGEGDLPEDPTLAPDLSVLTFGGTFGTAVYVDSSPQQTLQLKNGGKKDLVIANVSIEGPDAALFTAVPSGQTAESGKAVFVVVTYAPTAAGSHSASLVIQSNTASYELKREGPNGDKLDPLPVGPTTKIALTATAVWRYQSQGLVTDTAATPAPLKGIKVSCVKPKGTACAGDSDCQASGLSCVDLTCQNPKWRGWEASTGDDGRFSADHSWECAELLASDPAATPVWASNVAAFKADGSQVTVRLDGVYKVQGLVQDAASSAALGGIRVTCMAPPSAPLSWAGWNLTTSADGRFAQDHVWPCKELYAEDLSNAYAPATGTFNTLQDVVISMTHR